MQKGKQRLKILKYTSGKNWGAVAKTLRSTYAALIRPVLDYGAHVYHVPANNNLDNLERVQLAASKAITGLREYCTIYNIALQIIFS